MSGGFNDPLWFAVQRLHDNRMHGLVREVAEFIDDCDDPEELRKIGQSLKLLADAARGKGFRCGGKFF
jgi:hypothetical protein